MSIFEDIESENIEAVKSRIKILSEKDTASLRRELFRQYEPTGQTILHAAAKMGYLELVQEFLSLGADVRIKDKSGKTALGLAKETRPTVLLDEVVVLLKWWEEWQEKHRNINFNKAVQLIKSSYAAIEPGRNKDVVLFIGATGSGKSTLINYLMGSRYAIKPNPDAPPSFISELVEGREIARVGHGAISATLYPQIIQDSNLYFAYCDLPGLLDNRGEEERICAASSIHLLKCIANRIKAVVMVVGIDGFTGARAQLFRGAALALSQVLKGDYGLIRETFFVVTQSEVSRIRPERIAEIADDILDNPLYGLNNKGHLTNEEVSQHIVLEAIREPFKYDLYLVKSEKDINLEKITSKAIILVGKGSTRDVFFVKNRNFVNAKTVSKQSDGRLALKNFKLPTDFDDDDFYVDRDGKVEKPTSDPAKKCFNGLLSHIRQASELSKKQNIIVADVSDSGQSRQIMRKAFTEAPFFDKTDLDFSSHDEFQVKFNDILLELFSEFARKKSRAIDLLPKEIEVLKKEIQNCVNNIDQWQREMTEKEEQKMVNDIAKMREQSVKQIATLNDQVDIRRSSIVSKERQIERLQEECAVLEKSIQDLDKDEATVLVNDTFTRPIEYQQASKWVPTGKKGRRGYTQQYQVAKSGSGNHEYKYKLDCPIVEFQTTATPGCNFKNSASTKAGEFSATLEFPLGQNVSATVVLKVAKRDIPENREKLKDYRARLAVVKAKIENEENDIARLRQMNHDLYEEIARCQIEQSAQEINVNTRKERLAEEIKLRETKFIPEGRNKIEELKKVQKCFEDEMQYLLIELRLNESVQIAVTEITKAFGLVGVAESSATATANSAPSATAGMGSSAFFVGAATSSAARPLPSTPLSATSAAGAAAAAGSPPYANAYKPSATGARH